MVQTAARVPGPAAMTPDAPHPASPALWEMHPDTVKTLITPWHVD